MKTIILDGITWELPYWDCDLLPYLTGEKYAALKADIASTGTNVYPIIWTPEGGTPSEGKVRPRRVIDGGHRLRAVAELRAEGAPVELSEQMLYFATPEEELKMAWALNDHRRDSLTPEQRVAAIVNLRKRQVSLREIAAMMGVSKDTVARALSTVSSETVLPSTVVGKDGKEREAHKPRLSISTPEERAEKSGPSLYDEAVARRPVASPAGSHEVAPVAPGDPAPAVPAPVGIKKRGLSEEEKAQIAESVEAAFAKSGPLCPVTLLPSEAPAVPAPGEAPKDKGAPAIMASQREDHNTPPEIIEAVTRFAPIALDPCSNAHSQVGAAVALTIDDDGLHADWVALTPGRGHIYINPPYDQETLVLVHRRARYAASRGSLVTTLVPAKTDQDWYQDAIDGGAAAVCFIKGRVRFWADGERQQGAAFPCLLIYYGSSAYQWAETVKGLGACVLSPMRMITYQERQQEEGTK